MHIEFADPSKLKAVWPFPVKMYHPLSLSLLHRDLWSILTWMCGSGFDLDGGAAPAVLLHLRHPLAGHLVRVVGGTHCDLVLDDALTFQLLAAVTAKQKHGAVEPQGFLPPVQ